MSDEAKNEQSIFPPSGIPESRLTEGAVRSWKTAFAEFLNAKVADAGTCRECKLPTMYIADHQVTPLRVEGGAMHGSGVFYPQAILICSNCGHTRYYNAVIAGVAEAKSVEG